MRIRRHVDDAGGGGRAHPVEEEVGEEKGAEVVRGKGGLQPFDRLGPLGQDQPRVVDEHVQPRRLLEDLGGPPAHRREVGQIEGHELDLTGAVDPLRDGRDGGTALVGVASGHEDTGAHPSQRRGGLEPDAGIATRDDDRLPLHVGHRAASS